MQETGTTEQANGREQGSKPLLRSDECRDPSAARNKLAVVVLSLRAPPELAECVASLLAQDVVPEIVVVNSGGGEAQRLLESRGLHVPVLEFQNVLFAGAARNAGIAATRSPIVAFLASDCLAAPGWVEKRLARHEAGCAAVASAVVNSHKRNLFAWAGHIATYGRRLAELPAEKAVRFGASYERTLFAQYGFFREDLRTGEDTEFHRRLPSKKRPIWAPEVQTIHRNPTSLFSLISDQYKRGTHAASIYKTLFNMPPYRLAMRRYGGVMGAHRLAREFLAGTDRKFAIAAWPLMLIGYSAYSVGIVSTWATSSRGTSKSAGPRAMAAVTGAKSVGSASFKSTTTTLLREARQAQRLRDWSTALTRWNDLLRHEPDRMEAARGRAAMLFRLRRYEESAAAFSEIVGEHPADMIARKGLAHAYAALKDWPNALMHWEKLLQSAPEDPVVLKGKARALFRLGRIDESEMVSGKCLQNTGSARKG